MLATTLVRCATYALAALLTMIALAGAAGEASASAEKHELAVASPPAAPISAPRAETPARFFTINEVLAKLSGHASQSDSIHLAAVAPTDQATDVPPTVINAPQNNGGPFGLAEFRAPDGKLWAKWRNVEADIDHDLIIMAQCRADPDQCTSPAARRFNAIIDEARKHEGRDRLASVNRSVNDAIGYMSDLEQYGVLDLWSAPLATFTTGHGDCEDYAIAKYVALKEAGVPAEDLQLLLVHDQAVHEDHAVLAARQDGHWLILDNRYMLLPDDAEMWNLIPLYAVDHDGVQLLALPFAARPIDGGDKSLANTTTDMHVSGGADGDAGESGLPQIRDLPLVI